MPRWLVCALGLCLAPLALGAMIYSPVLGAEVDTEQFLKEAEQASPDPAVAEVDRKEMGQYSRLLAVLIDTFQGYDSNQDQRLSIAEFLTLSKAYFPDSDAGQQKATARERFRAMDSDQDKHLVFTEYSQMRTGLPLHTPFNQGLLEGPSRSRSTFKPGQPSGEVPCVGENAQDLRAQNERLLKNLRPRPPIMSDISDFSGWKVVVPDDRYEEFKKSFEDPEKAPPREFVMPGGKPPRHEAPTGGPVLATTLPENAAAGGAARADSQQHQPPPAPAGQAAFSGLREAARAGAAAAHTVQSHLHTEL